MSKQTIKAAREQVKNRYGSALAGKASGRLCLALAAPSANALETLGPAPLVHAVIQAKPVDLPAPALADVVKQMRDDTWSTMRASATRALGASPDPALLATTGVWLHPALAMREVYVRTMREWCLLAMASLRDRLESEFAASLGKHHGEMEAAGLAASPTQVCWLNQTLRTWSTPGAIAAVAEDTHVRYLDVPRAVKGELKTTRNAVGVVEHRAATHRSGGAVVVAVIDGEISLDHPALHGRVVHRRNFTHEPWGCPSPHGTAVAGIIAAQDGGEHIGMAPGSILYNYKVLRTCGGTPAGDFELAFAIQHALEDGARVANCSVNSDTPADGRSSLVRACDNASALGMTIVKSAGNRGQVRKNGKGTITCPGDAKGVIVVGATGRDGNSVPSYSSRGPVHGKPLCPDLVAPGGSDDEGQRIYSCTVDGGFGEIDPGTSLAAPHVSGILALILEGNPDLTPDEQRDLLLAHCDESVLGEGGHAKGRGRISIAKLV